MPHKKNRTVEYILMAILALFVMYGMTYLSNTADSFEYKQSFIERGLDWGEDADFMTLWMMTEDRAERGEKIAITESTPKYLLYGLLINFIWIVMVLERLNKKYAQERMYGDAEWGTVSQFKHLRAKKRSFYLSDYPPFSYLFHAYVYFKMFKKVWRNEDEE